MDRPEPVEPGPGQESVWAYPATPTVEPTDVHIEVLFGDTVIAETRRAVRVISRGRPPVFHLPMDDVRTDLVRPSGHRPLVLDVGVASWFDTEVDGEREPESAWSLTRARSGLEVLSGRIVFLAERTDGCLVDGVPVRPDPGKPAGGWIPETVVGPFRAPHGTWLW